MALVNCYRNNQGQDHRREQNELEACKYLKLPLFPKYHFYSVRRRNIERLERQSRISSDSEADTRGKFSKFKSLVTDSNRYLEPRLMGF